MGYSDFANFKLEDGYALSTTNATVYVSNWVDVHSAPIFDVSCVTTQATGTFAGTFKLQKSNDLQFTGGNRPFPLHDAGTGTANDTADAPTGQGAVTATISAAGVASLNQYNVGYRWFRVVFTSTATATGTLNIFVNWKKP